MSAWPVPVKRCVPVWEGGSSMLLERFLWAKADEVARLRQQERKGALPVPFSGQRGDFIAALQRQEAGVPLTVIAEFKRPAGPSATA